MPAINQRRRTRKPVQKTISPKVKLFFASIISTTLVILVGIWLLSSSAISSPKYTVVYSTSNGDTVIAVYDFVLNEITTVQVPGNTYLNTAYELGEWRVESLGRLGKQEGYDGELLRMSLVKNFHFPIDAWVNGDLPSANIFKVSRILGQDSSLSVGEKLQLATFVLRSPGQNWYTVDLAETGYLKSSVLPDGTDGYLIAKDLPTRVGTLFTIPTEDKVIRVGILDHTTGRSSSIKNLSSTIHILGGDWAVVEKEESDLDCLVRGKEKNVIERISRVLKCTVDNKALEGNFDVEILVGTQFEKRF